MSTPRKKPAGPSSQTQKLYKALLRLKSNPDFAEALLFMKANAFWGRRPFDAGNFDAFRAATIEGRQTLVDILEIEIKQAEQWQKTPAPK